METRLLYVLVYPSPLFAAHWSFWFPEIDADGRESNVGTRIHATGDRLNGFTYEIQSEYNIKEDNRHPSRTSIGRVLIDVLQAQDDVGESNTTTRDLDTTLEPLNDFDRACREVPTPGPSLNSAMSAGGAPKRVEVKDCQWWIKQAVLHLVEAKLLLPLSSGSDPAAHVDALPRH